MKFLFASDLAVFRLEEYKGDEHARNTVSEIKELFDKADFTMLNMECVFGKKEDGAPIPKTGPNMVVEEKYAEYIHALKPDILGMANNHTIDFGAGVFRYTRKMMESRGYKCIGAGENIDEAYEPAIVEKDGISVSVIAVCENEFGAATLDECGTAGFQLGRCAKAIRKAVADGHKPIIYFHGGNEHNPFPSPMKVELYRHFIDLGAEAVIAMHTHCPQGYEFYEGKPIIYSMGNFFFPRGFSSLKSWYYGYMTELEITENEISVTVHPYSFDDDKIYVLKGEDKEHFMKYLECISAPISDERAIEEWFDVWCTTQPFYPNKFVDYDESFIESGNNDKIAFLQAKNMFNCEAHNEVCRRTFNMAYDGRTDEAKKKAELIRKLQYMEII